jgi:hypothetical protein
MPLNYNPFVQDEQLTTPEMVPTSPAVGEPIPVVTTTTMYIAPPPPGRKVKGEDGNGETTGSAGA